MGYLTDDGRHEGYLVPVFADGERGNGTTGGGIGDGRIAVGAGEYAEDGTWPYPTRPAGEVTGWAGLLRLLDRQLLPTDHLDRPGLHPRLLTRPRGSRRTPSIRAR